VDLEQYTKEEYVEKYRHASEKKNKFGVPENRGYTIKKGQKRQILKRKILF
jgi:hypothetical protein